jgi:hypothetical protein
MNSEAAVNLAIQRYRQQLKTNEVEAQRAEDCRHRLQENTKC